MTDRGIRAAERPAEARSTPERPTREKRAALSLPLTSDVPEEWRAGRYVTLTVGGGVDLSETYPTEANPEARG